MPSSRLSWKVLRLGILKEAFVLTGTLSSETETVVMCADGSGMSRSWLAGGLLALGVQSPGGRLCVLPGQL